MGLLYFLGIIIYAIVFVHDRQYRHGGEMLALQVLFDIFG